MKALVLRQNNQLELKEVPRPVPKKDELLVRVRSCGICGSDLRYLEGENPWSQQTLGHYEPNPDNMILGHEFMGEVVEAGDPRNADMVGRRVMAVVYNTCRSCEFCRTNRENLCRNTKHIGHGAGWGKMDYYPGGMAEYCQVWADHCYPVSDDLSDDEASTVDFMAIGLSAVRKAPMVFAEDALVIGAGPVGLSIIQFLKLHGARRVFVTDVVRRRLEIAEQVGADAALSSSETDALSAVKALTKDLGCRCVFDTVGTAETQRLGLDVLAPKGQLVNVVCNPSKVAYRLKDLNGERSIVSVANSPYKDMYDTLRMLEAGKVTARPLITNVFPLEQYREAFDTLLNTEKTGAMKVILKP